MEYYFIINIYYYIYYLILLIKLTIRIIINYQAKFNKLIHLNTRLLNH